MHGHPGRNIPADLHIEHSNGLIKEAIRNLGTYKTEKAITRIGRAIGSIAPVLQQFDQESALASTSGAHQMARFEKDRSIIIFELIKYGVFNTVSGRKQCISHPTSCPSHKRKDQSIDMDS